MDIKHRKAFARIKQVGNSEEVLLNDGLSLSMLLLRINRELSHLPNRYLGLQIEISFTPIGATLTSQESDLKQLLAGLDLGDIPLESEDDANSWATNPINPESQTFDPLLKEYRLCGITSHRAMKTPTDLALLRRHVESTYVGTPFWDGSHRW